MKSEVKQMWVNALRSGKYQQAKQTLRKNDSFCCLGVLCDLYLDSNESPNGEWQEGNSGNYSFAYNYDELHGEFHTDEYLPDSVMAWAGLSDDNPIVKVDRNEEGQVWCKVRVSDLNDSGSTFDEIADIIEEKL